MNERHRQQVKSLKNPVREREGTRESEELTDNVCDSERVCVCV